MALSSTVRKWLRYALDDLKVSRSLADLDSSHLRASAYHSQQAVEKALKGYLAHHQVRFPKTHNIAELLDFVLAIDSSLAKTLSGTKRLTKFAVEYRYPGAASRPMNRTKARSAVATANKAFNSISANLRDDHRNR